jgi:hypothetical protein
MIMNAGISRLTNLTQLTLAGNKSITDDGLAPMVNLTHLISAGMRLSL